jgi:small nuclear ribonucleoprotein (snRNP)-like protein
MINSLLTAIDGIMNAVMNDAESRLEDRAKGLLRKHEERV